jgi:hypothetical protein
MTMLDPPSDPALERPPARHRLIGQSRRRRLAFSHWWWVVLVVVVLALVVATVLILRDAADPGRTAAGAPIVPVAPISTPVVPPPAPDLPEGAFAGDGHYTVGVEIAPGRYVASGPSTPGVPGVWARCRLSDPPCGTVTDVIDSGRSAGQPTVTLRAGQIFETRGFKEWRKVA